jgi:hypothetical protein
MPWDEHGKYFYNGGPTISGFLWLVSGPEGEEYWFYGDNDTHIELPEGFHGECHGGGLINVSVLRNATIKDGVVRTFVPDTFRQVQALKVLLCPNRS